MEKFRAKQARDYFNKLVHIARKRVEQPNYSAEQLAWWCGEGGTPANHLVHERFEEAPLVPVPGMEEKLLAITERSFDKNGSNVFSFPNLLFIFSSCLFSTNRAS